MNMNNSNDNDPITIVEFCAGYGGLGLGIEKALNGRMRLIGLCELEGFAQANLISKMEAGLMAQVPIWSNLLTFPYRKFRGLVDIAVAGIPCQPHSNAGKRKGGADERFLFDDWLRGLEDMQPRAIFIENVEGLLTSKMPDGTLCIAWTIERLEAMGYRVEAGIFSASEVGSVHQRKRVFILAHRINAGSQGWLRKWQDTQWQSVDGHAGCGGAGVSGDGDSWPSRPGEPQHGWEPPRVVGDDKQRDGQGGGKWIGRGERELEEVEKIVAFGGSEGNELRKIEQSMGLLPYGHSNGLGISQLFGLSDSELAEIREWMVRSDNRTDELRLLGNGCVPQTVTRAFSTLIRKFL